MLLLNQHITILEYIIIQYSAHNSSPLTPWWSSRVSALHSGQVTLVLAAEDWTSCCMHTWQYECRHLRERGVENTPIHSGHMISSRASSTLLCFLSSPSDSDILDYSLACYDQNIFVHY